MSWTTLRLGDALRIKHGFAFKGEYFSDEGRFVVLTPGNFHEEGGFRVRPGKDRYYVGDIPGDYVLNDGDLIVAMTEQGPGLLGSSALVPEDEKYLHNQRLGLIQELDENKLDKRFLFYLFNTRPVRAQIAGSATGTKVRHTAPERIYRVEVCVPGDVRLQAKIGAILSAYDDLIENNRRRIQLLEESARLLYTEWFVHRRFPGHEHVKVIDGVPEGWTVVPLGELVQTNPESYSTKSLPDEIDYIDIKSVTVGRINYKTRLSAVDAPGRARRKASHGDVIWSNVRPNLRAFALVLDPGERDVYSTGFTVLSPRSIPFTYHYMVVTTDAFVGHLVNHATGASYPAVRPDDFQRATVLVPPAHIVEIFHGTAEPVFRQARVLDAANAALAKARDLLVPRLMNGEVAI